MKLNLRYCLMSVNLIGTALVAQDPAREIAGINQAFYKSTDVAIEVTTRHFVDNKTKADKETVTTMYKIPGSYIYRTADNESMANKHYKINIDHVKKIMIVGEVTNRASKTTGPVLPNFESQAFRASLDTVLGFYKKVSVQSLDRSTNEMTFFFKTGIYDYVKITYDKLSYNVLSYYVKLADVQADKNGKSHSHVYVISNRYIDKKTLSAKLFSESNYIRIRNKKIIPAGKYSAYQLISSGEKQL